MWRQLAYYRGYPLSINTSDCTSISLIYTLYILKGQSLWKVHTSCFEAAKPTHRAAVTGDLNIGPNKTEIIASRTIFCFLSFRNVCYGIVFIVFCISQCCDDHENSVWSLICTCWWASLCALQGAAVEDGRLKRGDQIIAVNGHCLEGVTHSEAVDILKKTKGTVVLTVLSWDTAQFVSLCRYVFTK